MSSFERLKTISSLVQNFLEFLKRKIEVTQKNFLLIEHTTLLVECKYLKLSQLLLNQI